MPIPSLLLLHGGVIGAVLNADSVDTTAGTSKSKLRGKLFP